MKFWIIASLVLASLLTATAAENVFLAQLTSEGARSQDGHNIFECNFQYGPNEVTPMGLRQHYLVGSDLKTNHAANLGLQDVYSPWQVNVRSTNHNMTLMGAQAELEALFPPNTRKALTKEQADLAVPPGDNSIIENDIKGLGNDIMPMNFQTLPIHAMDFEKDTVLLGQWCNKIYDINERNVQRADWVKEMEEKYKDAFEKFRAFVQNENMPIHQIYQYIDTINACSFNFDNLKDVESVKNDLLAFGFEYLQQYWSSEESRKIFVHGFFTDLQRYMDDAKTQFEDEKLDAYNQMKLALYFGTLETSYVVSRHLGYEHSTYPQFASQLLFHLDKEESGFVVSAEYNKNALTLAGECKDENKCDLTSFHILTKSLIADGSQLSSCSPAKETLLLARTGDVSSNASFTLQFIVTVSVLGFLSLIIGGFLGHKAAQKENKKRRISVPSSDPESLLA